MIRRQNHIKEESYRIIQSRCIASFDGKKKLNESKAAENQYHNMAILLDNLCKICVVLDNVKLKTTKNQKLLFNFSDILDKLYTELDNFEKTANIYFKTKTFIKKTNKEQRK